MTLRSPSQAAAEYVTVTGQGLFRTLEAFARDARDFVADYPYLVGGLVVLALIFIWGTRPRVK